MNILLVNDDGYTSPRLSLLARAAAARGHRVTVCAPMTQQSAKSHSMTIVDPLMVRPCAVEGAEAAWAVAGTPVDCARLGILELCKGAELVFSGINAGYNAGLATFVSGTVGAAREAAFHGVPAMAVSAEPETPEETMRWFADYAVRLGEELVRYPAPPLSVCNLNAPPVPLAALKRPLMCPVNRNVYRDPYLREVSPRGRTYYWLAPLQEDEAPTPGGDVALLEAGHVTCTFLAALDGCDQAAHQPFLDQVTKKTLRGLSDPL